MSKHFVQSQDGLVARALRGVAAMNPALHVLEHDKIIYDTSHDPSKLVLISGGGSGHEPAHSGYVGRGMLTAAVCGEVFASPSTRQIMTACELLPSSQGYMFIVTNYTGDMLHFGLAAEKLRAANPGINVAVIKSADDVAVGRKNGGLVGRRGLAGTIVLNKILGAAVEESLQFAAVEALGHAAAANLVTISAGLDHCHIPGRGADEDFGELGPTQCEIGLGIHNEPGAKLLNEIPPVDELVENLLKYVLDVTDEDRGYVEFGSSDKVALLINNLGGISLIEQNAILEVIIDKLKTSHGIAPVRVYAGHFMTSLNAPSFSITLLNVTKTATGSIREADILRFLDAPTRALSWPRNLYETAEPVDLSKQTTSRYVSKAAPSVKPTSSTDLIVEPAFLEEKLRAAANNVIALEPDLTLWDTRMGDGDCGKTLETGCKALLNALDDGVAASGSVFDVLNRIIEITEDRMGGTLGAIFGIYFAAFSSSLHALASSGGLSTTDLLVGAANEALINLRKHTPAAEGDRTVMDVLIPFCKSLESTHNLSQAVEAAHKAAEHTKLLKPKLGRATYVGGIDDLEVFPPDPGAWAVYEITRSIL